MQYVVHTFFVLTLVAALLGFTSAFVISKGIAQLFFYFFGAVFVLSLVTHTYQVKKKKLLERK